MRRLLTVALIAATACSGRPAKSPPRTEFLLSSADSTFWIMTGDTAVHVRGVPILLARYGGHFYELYTADDDFSYEKALLLGERLYSRDIASGDSIALFADTMVAGMARTYASAHPDERRLGPDDEGDGEPETSATAQIDVMSVFGPYISYQYHLDVDLPGTRPWHTTRRGVVDIKTGAQATIADLFGPAVARTLEAEGRRRYETTRDSILAERAATRGDDRRVADAFLRLEFDERSFNLSSIDGKPAIEFDVVSCPAVAMIR